MADKDDAGAAKLRFRADSDSPIIKGIVAVLVVIYSGKTADEIEGTDADRIFEDLSLYEHLSPNRHVGVYAMMQKIKTLARSTLALAA